VQIRFHIGVPNRRAEETVRVSGRLPNHGQTFHNPVREGLPTIHSESRPSLLTCPLLVGYLDLSGGTTQCEVTPLIKLRKKAKLPKLWPTMPGQVLLVRCATKESATPVIAMRMVSQRVGCMNKWKTDQQMP
jgi:hypothetical protein